MAMLLLFCAVFFLARVNGLSHGQHPCFKCGHVKGTGELSCCAKGGDWEKICGDPDEVGDSNKKNPVHYTWAEGIEEAKTACENQCKFTGS